MSPSDLETIVWSLAYAMARSNGGYTSYARKLADETIASMRARNASGDERVARSEDEYPS
jgi:hypothetical protein